MASNEIPQGEDEQKQIVANQLASTEIHLALTQEEVDVSNGIKLPLDRIPELGTAFSSLPSMFRTITTTISTPTRLVATDKFGNPIDPSILQSFKDGSGLLGSYRDVETGFKQARFHVAKGNVTTSVTQVPYDPTSLFMAAALAQVNKKLDSIQESVNEMFDYLRQRDKADMRGNLKTLADILNGYGLNYGNATYMANAHMKVLDIKQASEQDTEMFRGMTRTELKSRGMLELRGAVAKRRDKVLDYLEDCRLATYIHAFSLFLEPMLAENFESAKLTDAVARIEKDSVDYLKLYTECYNALDNSTAGSIDAALLGGLASAGKKLGQAIATTPIGEHTLIDEVLEDAGESVSRFNNRQSGKLTEKLHPAKAPDVTPFEQSLRKIDALHNQPIQIAIDAESIYILPMRQDEE